MNLVHEHHCREHYRGVLRKRNEYDPKIPLATVNKGNIAAESAAAVDTTNI